MSKDIYLTLRGVVTYSVHDEDCFFECIYKLKSIVNMEGVGPEMYLDFDSNEIPDHEFKALIGLFYRYKVDMTQLRIFINEKNSKWVSDKKAFWYKRMFSEKPVKKKLSWFNEEAFSGKLRK